MFILAMRSLIPLLLFAAVTVAYCDEVNNFDIGNPLPIKNGVIQVIITNRIIILNLTKTGKFHNIILSYTLYLDQIFFHFLFFLNFFSPFILMCLSLISIF